VREPENIIERSVSLATRPVLQMEDQGLEMAMTSWPYVRCSKKNVVAPTKMKKTMAVVTVVRTTAWYSRRSESSPWSPVRRSAPSAPMVAASEREARSPH
jgi:hypothetical protein